MREQVRPPSEKEQNCRGPDPGGGRGGEEATERKVTVSEPSQDSWGEGHRGPCHDQGRAVFL